MECISIFQVQSSDDEEVSVGRGSTRPPGNPSRAARVRAARNLQRPRRPGVAGARRALHYSYVAHVAWAEVPSIGPRQSG